MTFRSWKRKTQYDGETYSFLTTMRVSIIIILWDSRVHCQEWRGYSLLVCWLVGSANAYVGFSEDVPLCKNHLVVVCCAGYFNEGCWNWNVDQLLDDGSVPYAVTQLSPLVCKLSSLL